MKRTSYNIIVLIFACVFSVNAQQKLEKISKSINVAKDVIIDLNTSFTDIELDTWDKDILEVEAYIESDKLSKEDMQKALKDWDISVISVEGSSNNVSISTDGTVSNLSWLSGLKGLESLGALEGLSVVFENMPAFPEMPEMPEMPALPEIPELPEGLFESISLPDFSDLPKLPKGVESVNFDTEEYKARGEAYLDEWSDKYKRKGHKQEMMEWGRAFGNSNFGQKMEAWGEKFGEEFGENFGQKMEAWGENFGESWGENFGKRMEKWGEEFGEKWGDDYSKKMEAWGESLDKKLREKFGDDYEKEIEKRAERFAKKLEMQSNLVEKNGEESYFLNSSNSKVKKTLKIKMPKDAKLKVNVRHGELKVSSIIKNLKADLSHSKLVANSIDGSSTSINASYSNVSIKSWKKGDLKLNYVEQALLNDVERLVLTSNSSNISIKTLQNRALIDGSFGDLKIAEIADNFNSLNIILENSDANISLPKTDYELLFKGNRSKFNNEKTNKKVINNYPEGKTSNKSILVNAKYSNVVMH